MSNNSAKPSTSGLGAVDVSRNERHTSQSQQRSSGRRAGGDGGRRERTNRPDGRIAPRSAPAHEAVRMSDQADAPIEIDLTDPQDVMLKIEMLDLTEEEEDALLDQAMEVNRRLKDKLLSMEGNMRSKEGNQSTLPPVTVSSGGSSRSACSILPPINNDRIQFSSARLISSSAGSVAQHSSQMTRPERYSHVTE